MGRVVRFAVQWSRFVALILVLTPAAPRLEAQDLRTLREPAIPPACTILKAALTPASATNGDIEMRARRGGSDQASLDTARIQSALDHCAKGQAVELAADGANSAFLTGPVSRFAPV